MLLGLKPIHLPTGVGIQLKGFRGFRGLVSLILLLIIILIIIVIIIMIIVVVFFFGGGRGGVGVFLL